MPNCSAQGEDRRIRYLPSPRRQHPQPFDIAHKQRPASKETAVVIARDSESWTTPNAPGANRMRRTPPNDAARAGICYKTPVEGRMSSSPE